MWLFIASIFEFIISSIFVSHSQTTKTVNPSSFNIFWFFASLALFLIIFSDQYEVFDFGVDEYLQFSCPCQKHPLTSTISLYLWMTMSGLPGSFLECSLYLIPDWNSFLLTTISGLVFFDLILDILRERWDFETVSIMATIQHMTGNR